MDKKNNKNTNNSSKNKKFTHKMQANLLLVFCESAPDFSASKHKNAIIQI